MENITVRQYYKAMALNALIMKGSEEYPAKELVKLASLYADEMMEEDRELAKTEAKTW